MSNKKISELTELTYDNLATDDEFVVVDTSTNETKKLKYDGLSKLLNKNSVLKYGADPTGVADSTAAFIACLADNDSAYVPEGDFLVGDLELDSKKINGLGTLKRLTGASWVVIMQGDEPVVEGITFESIASPVNGQSEIKLDDGVQYPSVRRCRFTGTLYSVISADTNGADDTSLTYAAPANGFVFEGNIVKGSYSRHLYLHSVSNIRIVNNTFKGSTRDCIRLRQATSKALISGNTFDDIGQEFPDVIERPQNWVSIRTYALGESASIAPTGIFRCVVATSTLGANPTTTGAAEWVNDSPGYFETKDILDAFWSGVELVITNNIINKCAGFGFDIKGVEPYGDYVTGKVIISHNLIQNCYGTGINLSNADLTLAGEFRYANQFIISNNILTGNNRERFDVAQSPITLRQGVRSVIIAQNIIEKNFARAISIQNLSADAGICKDVIIDSNQIYSNGLPGNPSAIGINCSAVNGLIIKNNIVRNFDRIEEYKMVISGTSTTDESITFPARGNALGGLDIAIANGDTAQDITTKIAAALRSEDYRVAYETSFACYYYTNVREDLGVKSFMDDDSGQMTFTSKLPGTQGDGITVIIVPSGTTVPLYPTASEFTWDAGTNTLTVLTRSSTKPFHFIAGFNGSAPAEVKAILGVVLSTGTPSDYASQTALIASTTTTAGGVDGDELFFDARLEEVLTPGVFTGTGYTVTLTRNPLRTNSVQVYAMSLKDTETVSGTIFAAPKLSYIIRDNLVAGNSVADRFAIVLNNVEVPALIAYVDSDNSTNLSIMTTQSRVQFASGVDSSATTHLNTQSYLINQGIILRARLLGARGNNIGYSVEQQVAVSQPLRITIAPAYVGGHEIILKLPTDGAGAPIATTVADAEIFLRNNVAQGIMTYENNYINLIRPCPEGINGEPNVAALTTSISTTEDIELYRGTGDVMLVGERILALETASPPSLTALTIEPSTTEDLELFRGGADEMLVGAEILALKAHDLLDLNDPELGFDLFEGWNSTTAVGNLTWRVTANSGTNGMNVSTSSGKEQGIARLDTSTSATSAPSMDLGSGSGFMFTNTLMVMQTKLQVATLSTITERFIDRFGFSNSNTSAAPTNGIYFEYDESTSPNWFLVTMASSVSTRTDTGIAVSAVWKKFKLVITNNTAVDAYIDNVLVATNTTNIPTGTGASCWASYQKIKSAGTTARVTYVDYWRLKVVY